MITTTASKRKIKRKTISKNDIIKNVFLLVLYIAAVITAFSPCIVEEETWFNQLYNDYESYKWTTNNALNMSEGDVRPPDSMYVWFCVILLIIFILILLSFKTNALYFLIGALSIVCYSIFNNMLNIATSRDYTWTKHYDSWDYWIDPDKERIIKDLYRKNRFSEYYGTQIFNGLLLIITVVAFIYSIFFFIETYKRISERMHTQQTKNVNICNMQESKQVETNQLINEHTDSETEFYYCTQCGYKNPTNAKFCKKCGNRIE